MIQRQAAAAASLVWQMLNPDEKQKALKNEKIEILINKERSWRSFANDSYPADEIEGYSFATVSLESFHDGIHVLLGTGINFEDDDLLPEIPRSGFTGHMGNPRFAAVRISGLHSNVTDVCTV